MSPGRAVVIIELAGYCRRIFGNAFGSSYDVLLLSALEFDPALFSNLFKGFYPIFLGHCIAQSLTAIATHIVHADSGDSLHPGINSGGTECKSATAANADNADTVTVHKRAGPQKVHGGTEIFDERFRRSDGPRLSAALAIIGGVKCQG